VSIDPCAPAQPKRRSKAMMRRTHKLVKPGEKYVMAARFPISASVG
jgi:RNase P protein component